MILVYPVIFVVIKESKSSLIYLAQILKETIFPKIMHGVILIFLNIRGKKTRLNGK